MVRGSLVSFVIATLVLSSLADDVPQFRGTGGLGISTEKNLPLEWGPTENIRWKADLPGRGLSNPVIADGRVYVTAASGATQNRLHVLSFDAKTGKKVWERQFWATGGTQCHPKTNMAAPTPIVAGDKIYALFATADLVCLNKDGDLQWARSLAGDYPTVGNNVGMAASPVLVGDVVVVHMENVGESFAVGVDAATGANKWRVDRPRIINWNTPFVHKENGQTQLLLMTPKEVTAHDSVTGKTLWSFAGNKCAVSPSLTAGEGLIFVPGEKLTAIRPGSDGVEPEMVWQNAKLNPGYSSPVVLKGRIYTINNRGIVNCAKAQSGEIVWTHRLEGAFAASPLATEDRLYFVSEEGVTSVMKTGDEAKVLATNDLKETILASPVASDGAIYLRSDGRLWCIGK